MTVDKRHSVTSIAAGAVAKYRLVNFAGTHAGPTDAVQGVSEVPAAAGRAVTLTTHYSQMVEAAAAIAALDEVGAAGDGSGRVVSGPAKVSGRALSAAAKAGELVEVALVGGASAAGGMPATTTAVGKLITSLFTMQCEVGRDSYYLHYAAYSDKNRVSVKARVAAGSVSGVDFFYPTGYDESLTQGLQGNNRGPVTSVPAGSEMVLPFNTGPVGFEASVNGAPTSPLFVEIEITSRVQA